MENISEFNPSGYYEFYTMRDFVNSIARKLKVITWGAYGWTQKSKYLLRFRVRAHRHKGYIFVAVNGADLFDVWLTSLDGTIKKEFTNIYDEDFIDVIDTEIEKIPEYVR